MSESLLGQPSEKYLLEIVNILGLNWQALSSDPNAAQFRELVRHYAVWVEHKITTTSQTLPDMELLKQHPFFGPLIRTYWQQSVKESTVKDKFVPHSKNLQSVEYLPAEQEREIRQRETILAKHLHSMGSNGYRAGRLATYTAEGFNKLICGSSINLLSPADLIHPLKGKLAVSYVGGFEISEMLGSSSSIGQELVVACNQMARPDSDIGKLLQRLDTAVLETAMRIPRDSAELPWFASHVLAPVRLKVKKYFI